MEDRSFGRSVWRATGRATRWSASRLRGQMVQMAGGPARARVIFIFGAVLALSSADTATVGAVAPELEKALHIGPFEIGLLSSAAMLVGAVLVLPIGLLVDKTRRVPLLAVTIVAWSVASFVGGLAGSYSTLLLDRLALGAVAATAGPAIASLTGDYFPARERGRVYGYILAGEFVGMAFGFVVSGALASLISWRAAFIFLAFPGLLIARTLWRTVPEPGRGGQSRLRIGTPDFTDRAAGAQADPDLGFDDAFSEDDDEELAHGAIRSRGVQPNPRLVLRTDPAELGIVRAVRYILSIRTNVLLIISSALGYFFLGGLQTFVLSFVKGHYHVGTAGATLVAAVLVVGGLVGTLASGRITDAMLRRGFVEARIWIPAVCYLGAAGLLIPGILGTKLTPALWFDAGGAALLAGANPPLDAARLDIMPAGLWGRAEGTRTFLRSFSQALAPLIFGAMTSLVAGIAPQQAPVGTHPTVSPAEAEGLMVTFLIMLVALAAAGVFLLRARMTYPTDVATAAASQQRARPDAETAVHRSTRL